MTRFVAICGEAQHGKDTIANFLVQNHGFVKVAFADKLREIALSIDPNVMLNIGDKGMFDLQGPVVRLSDLIQAVGWDQAKQHTDVRRFLQRLGTEAGRKIISDSIWIDLHERESLRHEKVVVPDMRFPNEGDYLERHHAVMLNVFRPGFDNGVGTGHASEQHIEALRSRCHYQILNDSTIPDLESKIAQIFPEFEHIFEESSHDQRTRPS